jgi:GNAT superfamily N-acetyltransferase
MQGNREALFLMQFRATHRKNFPAGRCGCGDPNWQVRRGEGDVPIPRWLDEHWRKRGSLDLQIGQQQIAEPANEGERFPMRTTQAHVPREIYSAKDEAAVRECFSVFQELRPHLRSADEFVERWRRQIEEGYEIIYIKEEGKVVAAAGYRFFHTMAWGHILYIDDLVAAPPARGSGFGTALLKHLQNEARERGCDSVHLDTGYQRYLAHRAYLRNGFDLHCHHMAWPVSGGK